MDNIIENLAKKCRACLIEEAEMHYLFGEFHEDLTLANIVESNTSIEVKEDDGLSEFLCTACTTILVDFHNFRTVYLENEGKVKAALVKRELSLKEGATAEDLVNTDDSSCEDDLAINTESKLEEITSEINIKTEPELEEAVEVVTYTCSSCDENFIKKTNFETHMETNHGLSVDCDNFSNKSYVLNIVNDDNKSPVDLPEEQVHICKYCSETFFTAEALQQHGEIHKTYICDQCGDGFAKRSYLLEHSERHDPIRRYVCPYCGKAFQRRTVLFKHKRLHTNPREYVCELCGKFFNDKTTMNTHVLLIHRKERKFKCKICHQTFPLKATLDKHVERHDKQRHKEFECPHCKLCYRDKSSLLRHLKVKHTDNSIKFKCILCEKSYTTKTSLHKHQRSGCRTRSGDIILRVEDAEFALEAKK